jgi:citrate lyase subunit beta / citryl-CoA lyase
MRSLLFAGATRPDLVEKFPRSGPDAGVIDLEDAVPAEHKAQARGAARQLADRLRAAEPDLELYVRVNGVATSWFRDDLMHALSPSIDGVVVPKIEEPAQVEIVREALAQAELAELRLVAGIESARGVAHVERLLGPHVHAAYFGAEDFIADMGGHRTSAATEVLYARSRVVLAARVAGVLPIDQAVVAVRDDDAFRRDALAGRALGYRGKICIHPAQVELANEIFGASVDESDRARRLLSAWEGAAREGIGAVEFEGSMIDEPALRMARETLRRAGSELPRS